MGGKAFEITQWVSIISAKSFAAKRCKKNKWKGSRWEKMDQGKIAVCVCFVSFYKDVKTNNKFVW